MKKILGLLFFVTVTLITYSQNTGWDLIKSNDFVEAKNVFLEVLKKDSTDLEALHGLMFLSESSSDLLSAKKHVKTIVNNSPEENFYITFKPLYSGKTDKLVDRTDFTMRGKLTAYNNQASKLYGARKYKEANVEYSKYVRNFNWSFIGPFVNESGYGHKQIYAVENQEFDSSTYYFNEDKNYIKWVKPSHVDESLDLFFRDHLGEGIGSPTYYANSFFTTGKEERVQVNVSRSWPMKIWLDDVLIFESDEKINQLWDNETVELDLKKGTHRFLIKYSALPSVDDRYQIFNFKDGTGYGDASFTFRLTDTLGIPIDFTNEKSVYEKGGVFNQSLSSFPQIGYWESEINKNPDDWFNYYALARFYSRASLYDKGEERFRQIYKKHPESVFFQYLLSKFYAYNGKIEKMYLLLNGVDESKTPIYELMFEKFSELDIKDDKEVWFAELNDLNKVSPGNWDVIKNFITYYDTNGDDVKRDDYIKAMMKKYPGHVVRLKYQETRFSGKPTKQITAKEKKKALANGNKTLQSKFSSFHYKNQIRHYKSRDNVNKVLTLYDEMIKHRPYEPTFRINKSDYLFENSRYNEAISELVEVLKIQPYNVSVIEQIGDLYVEQKMKEEALVYYDSAYVNDVGYYLSSLAQKIEKIRGPKILKSLFETKSLDEILKDASDWRMKYKESDAVVLAYTNDLILDDSYTVEQYQQIMVGINKESGINKWTEFDFGFLGNISSAKVLKSNGSEVRPNVSGSFVVFKDLEPGDVIQIQGKVVRYNWSTELGREFFQYNYITFNDPLFYHKTELAVPEGMNLNYFVHKLDDSLEKSTNHGFDFYKWEFSEVDQVTEEAAVVDNFDVYAHIMVSSMTDWSRTVRWYQQKTYKRLSLSSELKELLSGVVNENMTEAQKVEAIYNYITTTIKYSYVGFLNSNFVPKRTDLTCSGKIGDCKDVATLMISMLRELGIESYYVLVKTQNYHSSFMLPSIYFDHVIVGYVLNGEMKYADLTTDFYPLQVLPEMDTDQYGLIIRDGEKELIKLPKDNLDVKKSTEVIEVRAKLYENRNMDLDISATYNGNGAGMLREYFSRFTEEEKYNYVIESIGDGTFNNLELKNYNFQNVAEISAPLKVDYNAVVNTYSSSVLDLIIMKVPYMTSVEYSSALSSPNRVNSLDLAYVTSVIPTNQKVFIEVPQTYKAVDLPKNVEIDNQFGTYSVTYLKRGKSIEINRKFALKRQRISPSDYTAFRTFFLKMLDEDSRYIALKKG